jgi:hypothetical protein
VQEQELPNSDPPGPSLQAATPGDLQNVQVGGALKTTPEATQVTRATTVANAAKAQAALGEETAWSQGVELRNVNVNVDATVALSVASGILTMGGPVGGTNAHKAPEMGPDKGTVQLERRRPVLSCLFCFGSRQPAERRLRKI